MPPHIVWKRAIWLIRQCRIGWLEPKKKQLKILVSLEEVLSEKPQAKPGEQTFLWPAASKRLNVNEMHIPAFTFGLFEAVFLRHIIPQASPGVSHILPLWGWLTQVPDMIARQDAFIRRVIWYLVVYYWWIVSYDYSFVLTALFGLKEILAFSGQRSCYWLRVHVQV